MTRATAIAAARDLVTEGPFFNRLADWVGWTTESQVPEKAPLLAQFLSDVMIPTFEEMGFTCRLLEHEAAATPFLLAERIEDPAKPTMLCYGHGDVTHGQAAQWAEGLDPWTLTKRDGAWYGRGAADNKGQMLTNISALEQVLAARGSLGFNCKYLVEMGEEVGSPGLREICTDYAEDLQADVLIASDGPRLSKDRPTIYLGSRQVLAFDLSVESRPQGYHSGNWGGLLNDPAIELVQALATLTSERGAIRVPEWVPASLPNSVRDALADCPLDTAPGDPEIDPDWGEPSLTPVERVYGWSSFSILAMIAGQPEAPVNAIPGSARARCQLRFVAGVDPEKALDGLRRHLDAHGWQKVKITATQRKLTNATRLDPADPWVVWAKGSITETLGEAPAILPNIGGTIPNDAFTEGLGLPTIWVPHSYPGCRQHGPDEHLPASIAESGVALMTGLFWDLGTFTSNTPEASA
ncbi:M20 family metallopeptidase [Maritimibacter alkaliphilus]|uniref:M20 family metallopeptidase n=1 Tax=Maritimibacter alkaliphilus TaxID=404236 RepID=UPI001C94B5A7|nr:M20 family metallopeptidase [Maritimibacter alkaliphilus]MBY6089654.1 M20 family metallopeptidase [Maritimibacter alkaliphilus]